MTCTECGSENYPSSPIDGVCVVCATRDWRICRTKLTEFRRDIQGEIEDSYHKLKSFLDSVGGGLKSFGVNLDGESIDYWEPYKAENYEIGEDIETVSKTGGASGLKNVTKEHLPGEILDLFFEAGYDVWEEKRISGDYVFYEEKDKELLEACQGSFSPDFMYQMYCADCWSILEQRRAEKAKETEGSGTDTYTRFCAVCDSYFTTEQPSHFLCEDCKHEWLSCSGRGCGAYFCPYKGRFSESYCPECRKTVPETNADLLARIAEHIDVELNFNGGREFREA